MLVGVPGDDHRAHAQRARPLVVLAHAVANKKRSISCRRDRIQRGLIDLRRRLAPTDLTGEDDRIDQPGDTVALDLATHHLRRKRSVGADAPLDSAFTKPSEHAQRVAVDLDRTVPALLLGVEDLAPQGVRQPHILMPVAKRLTHLDEKGAARMVDVADKTATVREATAECMVRMEAETVQAVREGTAKGDALQVARIAGIMAAKRTADLIPLCHPLPLTSVSVDFEFIDGGVRVTTKARVVGQTGVEMEALTAAAAAVR